jgi:hypothetical protein
MIVCVFVRNHPVILGVFIFIVMALLYKILAQFCLKESDDHTLDS